jgi:hypothetical protein
MRLSDHVFEHLFGLWVVVFVLPVIVCSVLICLPFLFLRPYLGRMPLADHASERIYRADKR